MEQEFFSLAETEGIADIEELNKILDRSGFGVEQRGGDQQEDQKRLCRAGWKQSEKEVRELRKKVTFAIFSQEDDLNKVTAMVDELFTLLSKADRI